MSAATRRASSIVGHAAIRARNDGNAKLLRRELGGDLVAHDADMLGAGADELESVLGQDLGEAGVLREEAVTGVDGLGAGDLAGGDDGRNVQIAVARGRRADADALIGQPHMHGVRIRG